MGIKSKGIQYFTITDLNSVLQWNVTAKCLMVLIKVVKLKTGREEEKLKSGSNVQAVLL